MNVRVFFFFVYVGNSEEEMEKMSTRHHTKLAQYVIQPKNTARSRYFAHRMRVSKGIKDSKASLRTEYKNGI